MPSPTASPEIALLATQHVARNALAFAVPDPQPVSPGHTLVLLFRPVAGWFDASREEQLAMFEIVAAVKAVLDEGVTLPGGERRVPDGYTVGFDVGSVAEPRIPQLHVHVIPRFDGTTVRGGVHRALSTFATAGDAAPLTTGGEDDPFAGQLLPLLDVATDVRIVAAFMRESGVVRLEPALHRALARGARLRLVTGDYLDITQASALERLLDLQSAQATPNDDDATDAPAPGSLETRVVETTALPGGTTAFHPKSWILIGEERAVAFVGSSNLSQSALETGIEWNLGVERARDAATFDRICAAFEGLWQGARVLDREWVAAYARRAREAPEARYPGEAEPESLAPLPEPRDVQREALAALRALRQAGRTRALVVLATGLGKTLVATLDYDQLREELGRWPRLLFLAHRREILTQAADHLHRLARARDAGIGIGWYSEQRDELSEPVVFGSVAKLARSAGLARLRQERFDYVVIDEVHHAAAESYRRILAALQAGFLLGLTATPERADDREILGLFDDAIAYRADLGRGIELGHLVPFEYHGVRDDIDYANIPWRNRRFDPELLARAAQTEARMQTLLRAWRAHPGTRTLVFCCSVEHARHVRDRLRTEGLRVDAVFSAPGSDDREGALRALREGGLDAVCAVDVFNEGVDVREIDRVVLLRPTESNVVFLQQIGRGLRTCAGKARVTILDLVGNHRVFLDRMRALLALGPSGDAVGELRRLLEGDGAPELAPGCSVELELEAKHLLARLLRVPAADGVERAYQELRLARGTRPTAGALLRHGYDPAYVSRVHGGWFRFVGAQGDLDAAEEAVEQRAREFLVAFETAKVRGGTPLALLEAFLELDGLTPGGVSLPELAERAWESVARTPEWLADVPPPARHDGSLAGAGRWRTFLGGTAVEPWIAGGTPPFGVTGDRFAASVELTDDERIVLSALLRELLDCRVARHRQRNAVLASGAAFECKVIRNASGDPIMKLPRGRAEVPSGECDVRLPDGAIWTFRFMKEFCNVAREVGAGRNQLPDLLRRWFGPAAGAPGTAFHVRFAPGPDGLWVEPVTGGVVRLEGPRGRIACYPELRAAAGHAVEGRTELEPGSVALPLAQSDPDLFAVRVSGDSMAGGAHPLRHGDWAVLRLARGAAASAREGRVVLVESPDEHETLRYQLKRLLRQGDGWELASDNPEGPRLPARASMTVIARLEQQVAPEALAPPLGTVIDEADLPAAFGLDELAPVTGRHAGHLFAFVAERGLLRSPTELTLPAIDPRPAETLFALARRPDGAWRYLGVGRRAEDAREAPFVIPEVDHELWHAWGDARSASRALDPDALGVAQQLVNAILARLSDNPTIENPAGGRGFVRGRAARGGLRIDGGPGGFKERSVTLTDLAWVVVAARDVEQNGGVLDEARVNRVRYLEGTPKGATRWIDTGWAVGVYRKARAWETGNGTGPG